MTNAAIRQEFAAKLAFARSLKRGTFVKLDLQALNRLTVLEAYEAQRPRVSVARQIREARKAKPVKVDRVERSDFYDEDVRNEIYYGREIAKQLRDSR